MKKRISMRKETGNYPHSLGKKGERQWGERDTEEGDKW